jgi:hypothetical protein
MSHKHAKRIDKFPMHATLALKFNGDRTMTDRTVYGFDGSAIAIGDRIELHPATDLWMRGARYGVLERVSVTHNDRCKVRLDKLPNRLFACTADTIRAI